jgi:N-methylhydantoinase B
MAKRSRPKKAARPELDAITLEIMFNGLRSIADEMYIALMKSAYSTNIKERHDHSTCIMDAAGRTVVQAELTQAVHLYSMNGNVKAVLAHFPLSEIKPGDIFVSNDPYAAWGSHLPDINFAMPVFADGKLIAFVCSIAHHADIGGIAAGSMTSMMTEIYQEGLRLPVVRLFRDGELVDDVLRMILLNVRLPDERRGDYFAQVASCRLAERRLSEFIARYGRRSVTTMFGAIIERTERRLRKALAMIPPGEYRFEDVMDDDGHGARDIAIKVRIEVRNGRLIADFTGSALQVIGNINCPLNATQSMVGYVIKSLLDPQIPNNHGVLACIDVRAEPGTIVQPVFPAAVAYRAHTCQRVVDAVIGALADALPQRVIAGSNGANTTAIFYGTDPRSGAPYLYLETYGGGCGARPVKDGKDGVQQHIANTANLPIEAIETEYPLIVEEYSLAPDTGGAGQFRGGLALIRKIRPRDHACTFTGAGERFHNRPWGLFGGQSGSVGSFSLVDRNGRVTPVSNKPKPMVVSAEQSIVVQSPGAGGLGDPRKRARAAIARDYFSGKFSADYIRSNYDIEPETLALDFSADDLDYV